MRVPAGHLDHLVHYGGRERWVFTETWTSPILAIGMCTLDPRRIWTSPQRRRAHAEQPCYVGHVLALLVLRFVTL